MTSTPAPPQAASESSVAPVSVAARSAVTIADVIMNSTVFVTAIVAGLTLVLLFFRWFKIGWEEYTTAKMIQHLFMVPDARHDAPWYVSIGLACVFLLPTSACLLPVTFYWAAIQREPAWNRTADTWTARLTGVGLAAWIFFLVWLWFASMAEHGNDKFTFRPGVTYWLTGAACLLLLIYANARLARFPVTLGTAETPSGDPTREDLVDAAALEQRNPPIHFREVSWKVLLAVGLAGAAMPWWTYAMAIVVVIGNMWAWSDMHPVPGERLGSLAEWMRGQPARFLSVLMVGLALFLAIGNPSRAQLVAPALLVASILNMVRQEPGQVSSQAALPQPAAVPRSIRAILIGGFAIVSVVRVAAWLR